MTSEGPRRHRAFRAGLAAALLLSSYALIVAGLVTAAVVQGAS